MMAPAKKTTTSGSASKSKTAKGKPASAKAKPAASAKPTTTSREPRTAAGAKVLDTAEERRRLIETAAYLKAEADGFSGDPVQYWLAAESEVAAQTVRKPTRRK